MIAINSISDTQFLRARELRLPVRVVGPAEFILASATRLDDPAYRDHHRVTFDSASDPREFSCSCEAFQFQSPCWAAARALDILVLFSAHGVTFSAPFEPAAGGAVGAAPPALTSDDIDGATDDAVRFDGPLPVRSNCRFVGRALLPEGDPDAVLVPQIRRVGKVEKVRGFTI